MVGIVSIILTPLWRMWSIPDCNNSCLVASSCAVVNIGLAAMAIKDSFASEVDWLSVDFLEGLLGFSEGLSLYIYWRYDRLA